MLLLLLPPLPSQLLPSPPLLPPPFVLLPKAWPPTLSSCALLIPQGREV